ncbi:C45 family autoproteolytic acyltransferase/hydolase [uncultured Tolumonas sp.]|uniref:C45 family autoproteolytic acyltransferase/hydolase n=1 Tax=uncultured Tolumonas sp. TaxID=263765 RepID=UPI002930D896|nr:C45 family autoproteolytic acyltransferase/hydolase [uncultured Tolumonas sp.]
MKLLANVLLAIICFFVSPLYAANPFPDPNTVQWWQSAYRYSQKGWINLHIEGAPYERGLQHGRLLAPEIADYAQALAKFTDPEAPVKTWEKTRRVVNILFLNGFTQEQQTEMKGIADGASAAGARFNNRPLDVTDIAILNLSNELDELEDALAITPVSEQNKPSAKVSQSASVRKFGGPIRCNAFAAVGPATKDGKIVFGHITMFSLYPATFYNVWVDVKPSKGHHFVMQTTPGGIQSGMDYSINDAGIMLSETSVNQTKFDSKGIPLAARIRQAQQYASSIEEATAILTNKNNGLATAEWILADVKRNEIALLTLGTHKSKLYRSSKKEWIAGAEGFYWSNNNTKDLDIRLETISSVNDRPSPVAAFKPEQRDGVWLKMYDQYKGKIDADFAHKLLTTPEIVVSVAVDAKYTTSDMANQLTTWATFGPPLGAVRYPSTDDQHDFPNIKPLISNPWTILHSDTPPKTATTLTNAIDLHNPKNPVLPPPAPEMSEPDTKPAWHGTLLPKTDADIWLTTAFANYERIVALEKTWRHQKQDQQLTKNEQNHLDVKLFYYRSLYDLSARAGLDFPLAETKMNFRDDKWYDIVAGKGVLLLANLRNQLGKDDFDRLMDKFGRAQAGKEVSTAQFQTYLENETHKNLSSFFDLWIKNKGLPNASGSPFAIFTFDSELDHSLIVYGTQDDQEANQEAAKNLQQALKRRKHNAFVPIKADTEISEEDLKSHHLVLIGGPYSNRVLARFNKEFPVTFGAASFQANGHTYAHPESGLVMAGDNPQNRRFSLVAVAGLSALATLSITQEFAEGTLPNAPVVLLPNNQATVEYVAPASL